MSALSPLQQAIRQAQRAQRYLAKQRDARPSSEIPGIAPRPHKYGARRTEYGGQQYDSASEAAYAEHLDRLLAAGEIQQWRRGQPITLVPGNVRDRITYRPDFDVQRPDGTWYHVDRKGAMTAVFRLKWRLLRYVHPTITLLVIDRDGNEILP